MLMTFSKLALPHRCSFGHIT